MLKVGRNSVFRWVVVAQVIWLTSLTALVLWWHKFVLLQAEKLAEAERLSGVAATEAHEQWEKTQRMFMGESAFFLGLILVSSVGLFWLYWRERRRTRSLEAFFASLTHELRTPLTSIRLQVESLADTSMPESAKHLVRRLLEDSSRLEGQVERALELARIEGGGPLHARAIDFRSWMERWSINEESLRSKRIQVQSLLASGEQVIHADPGALQVILRNLIENAVRHSGAKQPVLRIQSQQDEGGVSLIFRNEVTERSNIPTKQLGQLFQKGEKSGGAGVGLYLVRALMERMGGAARFSVDGPDFEVALRFRTERT